MSSTITFRPTEEQGGFIEGLLDSGDYASQSEIIREGLRLLQEQRASSKLEALRSLINEGDQSGISERSVNDIMQAVIARKRQDGSL